MYIHKITEQIFILNSFFSFKKHIDNLIYSEYIPGRNAISI